jgi:hypothetical protein
MRMHWTLSKCLLAGVLFGGTVSAQELMVYPGKGQSSAQQQADQEQCYASAKSQTGFDPAHPPAAAPPPPQQAPTARPLRGAAGGAAVGAIGGAIGGNAGKGAAIGAATGAVVGGVRRRGQQREQAQAQEQSQQQQKAAYAEQTNSFNRAYATCLEGRGYTVK